MGFSAKRQAIESWKFLSASHNFATPTHQTEPLYFLQLFPSPSYRFLATMNRGPGGVYAVPGLKNANSVKDCEECGKTFSIFRPKYHCRNCGKLALPLTHSHGPKMQT